MAGPAGCHTIRAGAMTPIQPIPELKSELRRTMRRHLAALPVETRALDSVRIQQAVEASDAWPSASRILGYVPLASEPDLLPVLRAAAASGRTVCVPRWNPVLGSYEAAVLSSEAKWVTGPYAVPEPPASQPVLPLERLDLIVVPGLAFDRHGWRLGRGRGFYDRLLRQAVSARRWGVAFDLQLVDSVPNEPHDVNVHIVVTPQLGLSAAQ